MPKSVIKKDLGQALRNFEKTFKRRNKIAGQKELGSK